MVNDASVVDTLYADDVCLVADNVHNLQLLVNRLDESCKRFGLVISTSKTQVLKQSIRDGTKDTTPIFLGKKALEEVSSFRYLGSFIRDDNQLDTEITSRIAKASASFGMLRVRVWDSHDLKLLTKISVYKAIILPILLYASETWCLYKRDIKRLDTFHLRCLRKILNVRWQDRIPNTEILRRTRTDGIEYMLIRGQLRWLMGTLYEWTTPGYLNLCFIHS